MLLITIALLPFLLLLVLVGYFLYTEEEFRKFMAVALLLAGFVLWLIGSLKYLESLM